MPTQPVDVLLADLTKEIKLGEIKNTTKLLRLALRKLPLTWGENNSVNGLPRAAWNPIWNQFLKKFNTYETRRRYKRCLIRVAEYWHAQGWLTEVPELAIPPQHRRRLTVSIDKLRRYRLADYQKLIGWLADRLTSLNGSLTLTSLPISSVPSPTDDFHHWLTLWLICAGICDEHPLEVLAKLRFEDVLLSLWVNGAESPGLVIRLTSRSGRAYTWFRMPLLVSVFLFAAVFRAKKQTGVLLPWIDEKYTRRFAVFLKSICIQAGVPPLTVTELAHCIRLDLQQVLPNPNLAVLSGRLRCAPVPADQMIEILYKQKVDIPAAAYWHAAFKTQTSGTEEPAVLPSGFEVNDELLLAYDFVLDQWRSTILKLNRDPPPQIVSQLDSWSKAVTAAEPVAAAQIPAFNLGWLIRWQILLFKEKSKRIEPGTRRAYWTAVLRVIREFPGVPVHKINTEILQAVLEACGYNTAQITRAAWKQFWKFLGSNGLTVPDIQWARVRLSYVIQPVRVLTETIVEELFRELSVPYLWAAKLGANLGLRVSEACHLEVGDVVLHGLSHVIVWNSKGGKSRYVDIPSELRQEIQDLYASRKASGPSAPLLVDPLGKALEPQDVSSAIGEALAKLGYRKEEAEGLILSFHSLRKYFANQLEADTDDVRPVAAAIGHSLPTTTIGSYLHLLDLDTVKLLEQWRTPLNRQNAHISVITLAELLGVDRSRVRQLIAEYNKENAQTLLRPVRPNPSLLDGARSGAEQRAHYLVIGDVVRLFHWLLRKANI